MNELPIIFENDEILLINKRAGLAVQGGEKVSFPMDELLQKQLGYKIYPVHRLDKETSGILVVAKNSNAARQWTELIASDAVKKTYVAICSGLPKDFSSETGKGSVGKFTTPIVVAGQNKRAITEYKLLCTNMSVGEFMQPFSLLQLTLGTGRTHQIRIHLAQSGCPIIADDKYGNFKLNKFLRKEFGIKTLQLAAIKLTIPLERKKQSFQIPLPLHMQQVYDKFFSDSFSIE